MSALERFLTLTGSLVTDLRPFVHHLYTLSLGGLEGSKSISLAEFFVVSTPGSEIGHGGEGAGAEVFDQAG